MFMRSHEKTCSRTGTAQPMPSPSPEKLAVQGPYPARPPSSPGGLAGRAASLFVGAALPLLLRAVWQGPTGAVLLPEEAQQGAIGVLLLGAGLSVVAATLAGGARRASLVGAAVLPSLALAALAVAPRQGQLHVEVGGGWLALGALGFAALALALRSRARDFLAWTMLLSALVCFAFEGLGRPSAPPAEGPELWLITLDTTRADHLSFVGGDVALAHTPHLDAFAATAVNYRSAWSPLALTAPAHTSLLSGQMPARHGIIANGRPLSPDIPWVPERLRAAGYRTRAFVSASVLDASLGFDRGFDRYDSAFSERVVHGEPLLSFLGWRRRAGSAVGRPGAETVHLALATEDRGPRFTWVHLYDPHWPYTPSLEAAARAGLADNQPLKRNALEVVMSLRREVSPEERDRGAALYRAELEDTDRIVGALLAGIGADATVIITADHGESLGEHGLTFSHGKLSFAPDTHVPLLVRRPGQAPAVVDSAVSLIDLGPTLLELAGLPIPDDMEGLSLLHPDPARRVVSASFAQTFPEAGGTELGPFASLALRGGADSYAGSRWDPPAPYDRVTDPRELHPGLVEDPLLRATFDATLETPVPESLGVDPSVRDALRALGYMDP